MYLVSDPMEFRLMIVQGIGSKQPSTARLGITRTSPGSMQGALMGPSSSTAHPRSSTMTIWVSFYSKTVRFFPVPSSLIADELTAHCRVPQGLPYTCPG